MAGTSNSWNNAIAAADTQIVLNAGTNGVAISTDASAATVDVATGAAVKTLVLGSTTSTSASTLQSGTGALNVTATNGTMTLNSGTGALGVSTDAAATTVSFATGAAVKGVTLGSTNSTSSTTVQSGTGALNVTATGGALTINSGVGALSISNDAAATTVDIATGAGAKTLVLGSTNSTSSTHLQAGSGGVLFESVAEGALITSSTSVISTVTGTAGYVLTANTAGTAPSFQPVPANSFPWTVTTTNATLAVNNGYIANKAGLLTMTLPSTATVGQEIAITNINTAIGWQIAQNALQQINFGNQSTTAGVTGYLQATQLGDTVNLICTTGGSSTIWTVVYSMGNITIN